MRRNQLSSCLNAPPVFFSRNLQQELLVCTPGTRAFPTTYFSSLMSALDVVFSSMKLLFVTPYVPSPPTFGGQRRIHGLMHALAKRHTLSLLALHNPIDPIDEWRERTRTFFRDTELFVQPAFALQGRNKRSAQLRSLLGSQSWDAISYRNETLAARLRARTVRNANGARGLRKRAGLLQIRVSYSAARIGISQMHVSRLLRRALAQLRDSVGDVDQLTDAD